MGIQLLPTETLAAISLSLKSVWIRKNWRAPGSAIPADFGVPSIPRALQGVGFWGIPDFGASFQDWRGRTEKFGGSGGILQTWEGFGKLQHRAGLGKLGGFSGTEKDLGDLRGFSSTEKDLGELRGFSGTGKNLGILWDWEGFGGAGRILQSWEKNWES